MRMLGWPCASAVAMAMALASLGSVFLASSIQASNNARGSSRSVMPPSSMGLPMSLMILVLHPCFARGSLSDSLYARSDSLHLHRLSMKIPCSWQHPLTPTLVPCREEGDVRVQDIQCV